MHPAIVRDSRLNRKTLLLIQTRPRSVLLKDIAAATGINEAWLKNYSSGRIKEPSVIRVEKLYEYFVQRKLSL